MRYATLRAGVALFVYAQASLCSAGALSDRDRTFLRLLFSADEAKAVEYVTLAGINVNSIGGMPLSAIFYQYGDGAGFTPNGLTRNHLTPYIDPAVHRLVFEQFLQNPNPESIPGDQHLASFCRYSVGSGTVADSVTAINGTEDQRAQLRAKQETIRHNSADKIAAGFDSLLRYGLKDKSVVAEMFRGCFFNETALDEYVYDQVIRRMLRAGVDVNASVNGARPVEYAVQKLNATITERLIRDGATLKFEFVVGARIPPFNRTPSNLYRYLCGEVRTKQPDRLLGLVAILVKNGISPYDPAGWCPAGNTGQKTASFYDAVVDAGNIELAKAIKNIAGNPRTDVPSPERQVAALTPPAPVARLGQWQIAALSDGRPLAIGTPPAGMRDADIRELRIECVAGGRLEYVPVPSKPERVQALWVDNSYEQIAVSNGRIVATGATRMSKLFLETESQATQAGPGADWAVGFVLNDQNRAGTTINGPGFSLARKYLLDHCKN